MRDVAERMRLLFRGHESAHGTYDKEDRTHGKVKVEIKKTAKTLRSPATTELWEAHLRGDRALGVVPINEQGLCYWGVIDVDTYTISHKEIAERLEKLGIPLIVCRSKSGGAHIFVFLREPIAAAELITKLRELASSLGYGQSEIFPKQSEVLSERGDVGNWLNMPYFRADGGDRYAVRSSGQGMSVERFLDVAEESRLTVEEFLDLSAQTASTDEDLRDGPPCLQYLAGTGVSEGGRNNALFAFGVLAKKKAPDNWEPLLEKWNHKFIQPPLSTDEVGLIIRSLRKKEYSYKCKDAPICNHCDKSACRLRPHGVGDASSPDIATVSILDTEPPIFFVSLSGGGTVECTASDILSSRAFQLVALEQLQVMLPLYKQEAWLQRMQVCLENATKIEAPPEAGITGAFMGILEEFCTDRFRAQERDEILLGKPYQDEESGQVWFRMEDLVAYLARVKFRELTRVQIYDRIRRAGGGKHFFNLKGRGVNLWWVPSSLFQVQTEPHSVPRVEESPI